MTWAQFLRGPFLDQEAAVSELIAGLESLTGADIERRRLEVQHKPHRSSVACVASVAWPKELAAEAFHGPAGEFTRAIALHSEADPAGILVQTLAVFGNAVGRGPYVEVEADRHHPNLFLALVGETAKGRKGSSWGHVLRTMEQVDSDWTVKSIAQGLSSGEGLIWAVRDKIERQVPVKAKGRVVDYEWVVEDPGIDDKRLLVIQAELGSTLRVLRRDGNTLSPTMREAWDTGNLRTLTKNSPAKATGAHISVIGHITRHELLRYLDDTEAASGWANRFLWFCVRRSKVLPWGGRPDEATLRPIIRRLRTALTTARTVSRMSFSHEARAVWEAVYPNLSADVPGLLGAVTSRAEAQTLRLALIYALLDGSDLVGWEHLRAALAVWQYAFRSAQYIFGEVIGDRAADTIYRGLIDSVDGLTRTEIRDLFGRHASGDDIDRALALLERAGRATCRTEKTGGRPVERWCATYATKAIEAPLSSLLSPRDRRAGGDVLGQEATPPWE
jgi:hypothetical protein